MNRGEKDDLFAEPWHLLSVPQMRGGDYRWQAGRADPRLSGCGFISQGLE